MRDKDPYEGLLRTSGIMSLILGNLPRNRNWINGILAKARFSFVGKIPGDQGFQCFSIIWDGVQQDRSRFSRFFSQLSQMIGTITCHVKSGSGTVGKH
jgi:hypothetical protein